MAMGRRASLTLPVVVFLLGVVAGCTRRNDAYCCSTAEQCADVGGVLAQCPSGQLCDDDGSMATGPAHTCIPDPSVQACSAPGECEAPTPACVDDICVECDRDAHCEDPNAPVCDLALHRCGGCDNAADCERFDGRPFCASFGACVECLPSDPIAESATCDATDPVCGADGLCRGCADHRECATGACDLATGMCVAEAQIAYVDRAASTANTACSRALPCPTIARGLTTARPYVVIAPAATNYLEDVQITSRDVSLIGYGARLTQASNLGSAIAVTGNGSDVGVFGLTIETSRGGADCTIAPGGQASLTLVDVLVQNSVDSGLHASVCDLIVHRCRIRGNGGGGIDVIDARIDLTSSIIDGNGDDGAMFGGINLYRPKASSRLAFNTIVGNQASATTGAAPGIACNSSATLSPFHSNIVLDNIGVAAQVSGSPSCSYQYSLLVPPVSDTGNITGLPDFVGADFRIGAASAAIGAANPDSAQLVPDDIDAQPRPNAAPDIGADEYYP